MSLDENCDDYTAPTSQAARNNTPGVSAMRFQKTDVLAGGVYEQCRRDGVTLTEMCLRLTGGKDQIRR